MGSNVSLLIDSMSDQQMVTWIPFLELTAYLGGALGIVKVDYLGG